MRPFRGDNAAAVRATNDDAQVSKMSCVRLGYFRDEYLRHFVRTTAVKRAPLINRGYYARHSALADLLSLFLSRGGPSVKKQIISLGAGYDTTWFQVKAASVTPCKFIEIDFQQVTKRKAEIIMKTPDLRDLLAPSEPVVDLEKGSILCDEYSLVPADLRDLEAVEAALKLAGLCSELPTLILSECVLVYLPTEDSQKLVSSLGRQLPNAAFVVYEQIKPYDPFGKQMMMNLESRGCPLVGIHGTPDLEQQRQRFLRHNWQVAWALDMDSIYIKCISPEEKHRIGRLEIFDELEEWHLIQAHYCIAVGINDSSGLLANFELPVFT